MPSIFQFIPLAFQQNIGPQVLARTPEPDDQVITDNQSSVSEYDQVMKTKLAISYALATEVIYRVRSIPIEKSLDIACGPGHLSINMARDLGVQDQLGIDLSDAMVKTASLNAETQKINNVRFQAGDATKLGFDNQNFDLCTMMDAAHHLPSIEVVQQALVEMDRVTRPDGHIVLMDLVRLRTKSITEKYIRLVGADYKQMGLNDFYQQFRDSMLAAWTPEELASAVPADTNRQWWLVVPRGLPYAQFLIATPIDQKLQFKAKGETLWTVPPVPPKDISEYRAASLGLSLGAKTRIR
jgi:ubiquinone/menaquinone biosynthesis C-methylase UbiE